MTNKKQKIFKVISVVLSAVLSIALALSLVITTFLSVGRDYLTSQEFNSMIDSTDLATMKFTYNDEKITLEKFVKDYVTEKIEDHIKNNPLSNYTNFLFPLFDSITDFTVDKALSSEYINSTVKGEIHSIIDYFLHSNVNDAKDRIKSGITLEDNVALNPDNAPTYEERIKAEVKLAVFKYIEEESGKSCDEIIVLLSENNISKLKTISVVLFALLLIASIPTFPSVFLFVSIMLISYRMQVYSFINDFKTRFAGDEYLISFKLIKPIADVYATYVDNAQTIGIICLVLFIASFVAMYFIKKKKQ